MSTPSSGTITTYSAPSGGTTSDSFTATLDGTAVAVVFHVHLTASAVLPTVSSLTVAGAGSTLVPGASSVRGALNRMESYYRFAPSTGSVTIAFTLSATARVVIGVVPVIGLDTSSAGAAFGTAGTATGAAGTNPSVVVGSAAGELVMDAVVHSWPDADSDTVTAGQTQLYQVTSSTGGTGCRGFSSTEPGAASVTMNWTKTGGTTGWAQVGFGLRGPAAFAGPPGKQIHVFNQAAINRSYRY